MPSTRKRRTTKAEVGIFLVRGIMKGAVSPKQERLQSGLHRQKRRRPACVAGIECFSEYRESSHTVVRGRRTVSSRGNVSSIVASLGLVCWRSRGTGRRSYWWRSGLLQERLERLLLARLCSGARRGSIRSGRLLLESWLHVDSHRHVLELDERLRLAVLVAAQIAARLAPLSIGVLPVVLTTGLVLADDLVEGIGGRVLH